MRLTDSEAGFPWPTGCRQELAHQKPEWSACTWPVAQDTTQAHPQFCFHIGSRLLLATLEGLEQVTACPLQALPDLLCARYAARFVVDEERDEGVTHQRPGPLPHVLDERSRADRDEVFQGGPPFPQQRPGSP